MYSYNCTLKENWESEECLYYFKTLQEFCSVEANKGDTNCKNQTSNGNLVYKKYKYNDYCILEKNWKDPACDYHYKTLEDYCSFKENW